MTLKNYVEVRAVTTELERDLIRSALESYGIEVMFRSFLPSSVYPGLTSIKALVPEKDLELARKILAKPFDEHE